MRCYFDNPKILVFKKMGKKSPGFMKVIAEESTTTN